MHVPCFIKGHLRMSASDQTTLKKKFGGSKPFSKLTLNVDFKNKKVSCCDDSQKCKQLKKHVTDKYNEKHLKLSDY